MKRTYLASLGIIIIAVFLVALAFSKPTSDMTRQNNACRNSEYALAVVLRTGEKGTLQFRGNGCEIPTNKNASFSIAEDGAVENNLRDSRLYIWSRDKIMSLEQQLAGIAKDCAIKKNSLPQYDGLTTYSADCLIFGPSNEYASETFLETNNVLIGIRQDGADGIEPIDFTSLQFIAAGEPLQNP